MRIERTILIRKGGQEKMITSSANSRVKQVIQWQTKAKERKKAGVFLTEGFKMYEEAPLESILEVYVAESALASLEKMDAKEEKMAVKLKKTGYEVVADSLFKKMADTQTPQGILCVVKQPEYRLEEILKQDRPLLMILENLQDPGNLGTIIRTGEGAGVTGVIMTAKTVDIFNPKVIRATMGSVFRVPFLYVEDMEDTLKKLKEKGIRTYAAHLAGREYYDSFSFTGGTAFLIGNEGNGLEKKTADLADSYLKIPMEGKVESLNAAIAASLLMYEAQRQRRNGKECAQKWRLV